MGELSEQETLLLAQLGFGIGIGATVLAYIVAGNRDWGFIDTHQPTRRDIGWLAGGLITLLFAVVLIDQLMAITGVEQSPHTQIESAMESPAILYVLIPTTFLIVGPVEELLFRNIVQKTLYDAFSRLGAVFVTSVIFAGLHIGAFINGGSDAVIAGVGTIFFLSVILGYVYERTDNIIIPALIHGGFNTIVYLSVYMQFS